MDIVEPQYLALFLNSRKGQEIIASFQNNSNREGLNYTQIKSIKFKAGSIEEQQNAINYISDKINESNMLEQQYLTEIEKYEKLRQAILQEAFQGLLSSPLPDDDKVEDLLEQIKKEKESYLATLKNKKKMASPNTKKTLKELSQLVYERLKEWYGDVTYTSHELKKVYKYFADSEYTLLDDKGKIKFEDFANAFAYLIRNEPTNEEPVKINMFFHEGAIVYQNNLSQI
ncbi:MAG: hypothetical protein K1X92_13425 [Bacteroidia bacterium]|nr:hypothetical protein [Bacteroidia bacterium]